MSNAEDLLASVASLWKRQIKVAKEDKDRKFGRSAKRCWDFLGEDYENLYIPRDHEVQGDQFAQIGEPSYKVRRNLTFDFVATFLPFIFDKIPDRRVNPSRQEPPPDLLGLNPGIPLPQNPMAIIDKLRAWLMQWWLNYTPKEYDYRGECRRVYIESLVKGRGVAFVEMIKGTNGLIPAAKYYSVDKLIIDPDAERINEAGWISLSKRRSIWQVAEEFKLSRQELRAQTSSKQQEAIYEEDQSGMESEDPPRDVMDLEYVWTRGLGIGQKMLGTESILKEVDQGIGRLASVIESLGHNCWLVISPDVPYPLNLPPEVLEIGTDADIRDRLEWPIPFHFEHTNPWPFAPCDYYPNNDNCWATSPIKAALPLQEFIDRSYSYMMARVIQTNRTLHICDAGLEESFDNLLKFGVDQEIAYVKGKSVEDLSKMYTQMDFGEIKQELWRLIAAAEIAFEKSTGMTSLLQGSQGATQIRTASEAQIRQGHSMNRPEDMADCAEDFQAHLARMEGFATRVMVGKKVVAPLFGEEQMQGVAGPTAGLYSALWEKLVNTDPERAAKELSYSIEAGSSRRKNRQTQISTAEMLMQALGQPLLQYAQMNPMPWNALVRLLGDAYDTRLDDMMLSPPQMMGPQMIAGPQQQLPPQQGYQR